MKNFIINKKCQENPLLDKTNKIFFLPTGFIESLTGDNVTIINSQQENMQLFRETLKNKTKSKYPFMEYYSGENKTNGSNMIGNILKEQEKAVEEARKQL